MGTYSALSETEKRDYQRDLKYGLGLARIDQVAPSAEGPLWANRLPALGISPVIDVLVLRAGENDSEGLPAFGAFPIYLEILEILPTLIAEV